MESMYVIRNQVQNIPRPSASIDVVTRRYSQHLKQTTLSELFVKL